MVCSADLSGSDVLVKQMQEQIQEDADLSVIPRPECWQKYQRQYPNQREAMAIAYGAGDYSLQRIADFYLRTLLIGEPCSEALYGR